MHLIGVRPSTTEERQLAGLWFAAATSVAVLRPVWIAVAPYLRPCAFRSLTGIPCPTCGTTRTALALLELDIGAALAFNPLATAAAVVFFAGGALALPWLLLRLPTPVVDRGVLRVVLWGLVTAAVANWSYLVAAD